MEAKPLIDNFLEALGPDVRGELLYYHAPQKKQSRCLEPVSSCSSQLAGGIVATLTQSKTCTYFG